MKQCLTQSDTAKKVCWIHVRISKNQTIRIIFVSLLVLCSHSWCKRPNPLRRLCRRVIASPVDGEAAEGEVTRCGRCRRRCSVPPTPLSELGDTDANRQGVTAKRRTPHPIARSPCCHILWCSAGAVDQGRLWNIIDQTCRGWADDCIAAIVYRWNLPNYWSWLAN